MHQQLNIDNLVAIWSSAQKPLAFMWMLLWCIPSAYILLQTKHTSKGNSSPNGRSIVTRTLQKLLRKKENVRSSCSQKFKLCMHRPSLIHGHVTLNPTGSKESAILVPVAKGFLWADRKNTCQALCTPPAFTSPKKRRTAQCQGSNFNVVAKQCIFLSTWIET